MALSLLSGSSFRRQSVAIFFIRAVPAIANVLVIVLLSRGISLHLYGVYQNFWVQLFIINAIAMLGIPAIALTLTGSTLAAVLRDVGRWAISLWVVWLALLSCVFAYLQYISAGGISPVICFLFSVMYGLISLGEGLLIPLQRFKGVMLSVVIYTAIFVALHIAFLKNLLDLPALFKYLLILFGIRALALMFLLLRGIAANSDTSGIGLTDTSALSRGWIQLGIYDIGQLLFRYADKFIIGFFLSAQSLAIYFNGAQEVPLLAVFLGAIKSAALMQLADDESETTGRTLHIVNRSAAVLSSVVFPVFYFLLLFREELLVILLSPKYLSSADVFMAAILVLPLRAYNFTGILQSRHKGKLMNWGALLDAVIALALVYPLYLIWGLPGIALAFVISTYVQSAFYLVVTGRLLGVSPLSLLPWKDWLLKAIGFGCLFIAAHYILVHFFAAQIVLLLGVLLWAATIGIALRSELQNKVRHGKTF